MRAAMVMGLLAAGLGMAVASIAPAAAQAIKGGRPTTATSVGEGSKLQESNEWTVGLAGGLLEGTNIRFAAEMATATDSRNRRVPASPPHMRASQVFLNEAWYVGRHRNVRAMLGFVQM